MKRVLISVGVAAVVAVPAVIGLWGNASFSQAVPVRAPASGQVVVPTPSPSNTAEIGDDHGGETPRDQRTEPGDDRDVQGGSPAPIPSPSASGTDDHGGETPRDQRTEPGDDRGTSGSDSSGGGSSGSGSSGGGADDHGGHGSDD